MKSCTWLFEQLNKTAEIEISVLEAIEWLHTIYQNDRIE